MDDFKDAPISIGEIKSEKESDGSRWTVRDMLIKFLRDIDNGLVVDVAVILYRKKIEEKERIGFYQSSKDTSAAIGVASGGLQMMIGACIG